MMKNVLPYLTLAWFCGSCQKTTEPHNILMIAVDDMNNWVGVMENKAKTPNIDAFAKSGMLFNNAYCVAPACNPSRTSLLTGLRPETTNLYTNKPNFRDQPGGKDIVTLPQYLREFGYEAVSAGKIFHAARYGEEEPHHQSDHISWNKVRKGEIGTPGRELFINDEGNASWLKGNWKQKVSPQYITTHGVWGGIPNKNEECGDWQSAQYCADYLMEDHEKPFFLAFGTFRPHVPHIVPQKYIDMYPIESVTLPEIPEDDMDDIPAIAQRNHSTPFFELIKKNDQWEKAVQGYLASMTFADDCVGHVLEALENSKYKDNTIVLLWTDHGWHLGHKNRWRKWTLWRQGTNTPLIVCYPGMKNNGEVCSEAVSLLDIYPTLLDLAGLPQRDVLEGESLVPWLLDPSLEKETPAIVTYPKGNHSVVWKNWNYIHYEDGSEELYDHKSDPREYNNLAGKSEFRELMDRLKEMIPVAKQQ